MGNEIGRVKHIRGALSAAAAIVMLLCGAVSSRAQEPIKIGFSMELTGPFAVVGKTGLLAFKIWEEEINAKGGLLGRPVKLVYYDDQSNPAQRAGDLYQADRHRQGRPVDVELRHQPCGAGDAGGDLAQPAVLRAVRARGQRQVPLSEIFLDAAVRPRPGENFRRGLFRPGGGTEPEAEDGGDRRHRCRIPAQGRRERAHARQADRHRDRLRSGLSADHGRLHADRSRDPGGPAGYGLHLVIPVRHRRHSALDRGGRAEDQHARRRASRAAAAAIKMQLGEAINGLTNIDLWEPVKTMQFPGVMDFIKTYQAKAPAEGVDLLGYFLPPFAYSELQILGQAVAAAKTLDSDKLAEYMHSHPFQTIEGDIAFGPDGEWTEARPIWVQYHDIKGHDVDQFRGAQTVTILAPEKYKTGDMIYPYAKARGE